MVCARYPNLGRITISMVICCSAALVLSANTAAALPGSGTQEDPWRIESLADFDEFAADANYWDDYTRLETDVNLAGRTYSTAVIAPDVNINWGFQGTAFTGVFDGNGHKMTNLTVDDGGAGDDYLGLFGYLGINGQVKNLGIEGGTVSGSYYVGGLVAYNTGSVSNCYPTGDVSGDFEVGGIAGRNGGSVSNCYSTGDVSSNREVGGLVGINSGSVLNCYSTSDVSATDNSMGGLVGINSGRISNCYSTGDVSGVASVARVGGLVGHNDDSISNSYSTGDVTGYEKVGGLVGSNSYHGSVSNCYSIGDVNGINFVGGLVGQNGYCGSSRCYPGYIYNSYSTGSVQGTSDVGGLVGLNQVGDIESSFWDVQTSGEPNMCGYKDEEHATGCDPNCGKTTAEMQTGSTFAEAEWDFVDIWLINEGATYPVLRQEIRSDLNGDGGVDLLDFAVFASHWLEGKDE